MLFFDGVRMMLLFKLSWRIHHLVIRLDFFFLKKAIYRIGPSYSARAVGYHMASYELETGSEFGFREMGSEKQTCK